MARVGIVSNFRGGLKQFVSSLAGGLGPKGFDVEVLCPAQPRISRFPQSFDGFRVYYGFSAISRMFTRSYDLIHCNIASLGLVPIIRRRLRGIPIVETFHGIPQWWLEPNAFDKLAYVGEYNAVKAMARSTDARVSVSGFVRSEMRQELGFDSLVIHNGISHCPIRDPTRERSRREFNIEEETTALLFVGRMHPAKDPMTLLKAFQRLIKKNRNVKLFVVGSGPLAKPFQRSVREKQLERFVTTWDYLPSLHQIFSAADVFCFPSWNEAFGIVLLEAMDHSLPLLISDSGAAPEVAGPSGTTFRTGDEQDLCQKMIPLVDDSGLRHELGQKGPKRLQEHFTIDAMISRYTRLYEQTMQGSTNGR